MTLTKKVQQAPSAAAPGHFLYELSKLVNTRALGNPGLRIRTNFDIENENAISFMIDGALYSLAATTAADTGTTATIPAGLWGIAVVSATTAAALTVTWHTNNGSGYATEAAALAALARLSTLGEAHPEGECPIGFATVQAGATVFTAGTDALQGGTGGEESPDTNYYNHTGRIEFPTGLPT